MIEIGIEWLKQNMLWVMPTCGFVIIFCVTIIAKLSEYGLHKKLLGTDMIEDKRKIKKEQKGLHICSIVGWLLLSSFWVYVKFPEISWQLYAMIVAVMMALPLVDVYTTFKIIGENHNKELNPLGKFIMEKWGKKGSYIQVCFVWIALWLFIYYVNIDKPSLLLSYIFAVVTVYAGVFASNYESYCLMKKYPDLYWYTEWVEGKKVFGSPPK
jgi:hypothetical protein